MRKCVCISCFDYYSTRMKKTIEYFEKKEHKVEYLYADFDHFGKTKNLNKYKQGVKVKVPEYRKNLSPRRLYSHYVFSRKVIQYIRKCEPDFIYCMIPPNSLVKELAKYRNKHKNIKLVFDCYDMWPESFPYNQMNRLLSAAFNIWRNLRKKYIAFADLLVCVSEQEREMLVPEAHGKQISVMKPIIPVGDLPVYKSDLTELTFCYLGMVNHITDMDMGISILGELAKERKTILHIIGAGQNLEAFVKRLQKRNVDVVCHGCVFDMDKKNDIFSMCNFGLNIPRDEIASTMSLKAVEYMRAGLPFLNNAKGDIRNIVESDAIGFNINKEDIHSSVVERILCIQPEELIHMHENCVNSYKRRFVHQDYDAIFERLMVIRQ